MPFVVTDGGRAALTKSLYSEIHVAPLVRPARAEGEVLGLFVEVDPLRASVEKGCLTGHTARATLIGDSVDAFGSESLGPNFCAASRRINSWWWTPISLWFIDRSTIASSRMSSRVIPKSHRWCCSSYALLASSRKKLSECSSASITPVSTQPRPTAWTKTPQGHRLWWRPWSEFTARFERRSGFGINPWLWQIGKKALDCLSMQLRPSTAYYGELSRR
jgi:hypothetical protein